ELFLMRRDHGAAHRKKGAVLRRRAEGDQRAAVELERCETVADALFRLRRRGLDHLAEFLERGSLLPRDTVQVLVDGRRFRGHSHFPAAARSSSAMSILTIFRSACITRFGFPGSLSWSSRNRAVGTICHETPNLSVSQPHCTFAPPAESFSQYSS